MRTPFAKAKRSLHGALNRPPFVAYNTWWETIIFWSTLFTDKPIDHEKWFQYSGVIVDDQVQPDSYHLSASRRALHCSHPWGKLIVAGMWGGQHPMIVVSCAFRTIAFRKLFVSSGFKHLCFPPSKDLFASTGVHGCRRACRLDPTCIWCSKLPRWVAGTWWAIEFTNPCFCFFGQNMSKPKNSRQLPQDARETGPICCTMLYCHVLP